MGFLYFFFPVYGVKQSVADLLVRSRLALADKHHEDFCQKNITPRCYLGFRRIRFYWESWNWRGIFTGLVGFQAIGMNFPESHFKKLMTSKKSNKYWPWFARFSKRSVLYNVFLLLFFLIHLFTAWQSTAFGELEISNTIHTPAANLINPLMCIWKFL